MLNKFFFQSRMCWQCLKTDLGEDYDALSALVLTPNNYLAATVKDAQVIDQDTGYNVYYTRLICGSRIYGTGGQAS